jgi:hypothetical protein
MDNEQEDLSITKEFIDEIINIIGTYTIIGDYWYDIILPDVSYDNERVKRVDDLIRKYFL